MMFLDRRQIVIIFLQLLLLLLLKIVILLFGLSLIIDGINLICILNTGRHHPLTVKYSNLVNLGQVLAATVVKDVSILAFLHLLLLARPNNIF